MTVAPRRRLASIQPFSEEFSGRTWPASEERTLNESTAMSNWWQNGLATGMPSKPPGGSQLGTIKNTAKSPTAGACIFSVKL